MTMLRQLGLPAALAFAALTTPIVAQAADGELVVYVFEVGTGVPLKGVPVYVAEPPPPPAPPPELTPEELEARQELLEDLARQNRKRARKGLPPLEPPTIEAPPPPPLPVDDGDRVGRTDRDGELTASVSTGDRGVYIELDGALQYVGPVRISEGFRSEMLITDYGDDRPATALTEAPSEDAVKFGGDDEGPTGVVRGTITSTEDGTPIEGARIFVRGSRADAVTDASGRFTLEVGEGPRDLSIIHDRFSTQAVNNVVVVAGQEVSVSVEMTPAGLSLGEFVIRAPRIEGGTSALLDERRNSSAVGDVLGAEQMARSGDSSAASALTRVTGLTLVGGRYVYVRGLGERYSSVLLNGATLPSPEPARRVVPLDMFPAGILESVVIQKSYSPDMPGEFGGGSIQLRTKNIPTEPVFSLSVSGGYNSVTTFKEGLDYEGASGDFVGMGAAGRALPQEIAEASAVANIVRSDRFCETNCYSDEDLERWGEQMDNNWAVERRQLPPDIGLSLTAGTGSETALLGRPAGVLVGASFSNAWQNRDSYRGFYAIGAGEPTLVSEYDFENTENSVNLSTILALGVSPADGHEIRSTSLLLRRTGDDTRVFEGLENESGVNIRSTRLRYVERQLLVQQLLYEGEFGEGGPRLTLRYSVARATRTEPDRRQTLYRENEQQTQFELSLRNEGNLRLFGDLVDTNHDVGGELAIPFGPRVGPDERRPTIFVGGMTADKRRSSDTRRYTYTCRGNPCRDNDLLVQDAEDIFTPDNMAPDSFEFNETTAPTDNYTSSHVLAAGYLKAEVPLTRWLRVMGGARLEYSDQFTRTFPLFATNDNNFVDAEITTLDLLPAITATASPSEKTNIRLGYGRSVSRPDFREMSPAFFVDVVGGRTVQGNPDLERASIDNLDARIEYYPDAGESISLGVFYKDFAQPIERYLVASADISSSWDNTEGANLYGIEFEFRKSAAFLSPALRDFYVAGNVALIQSQVRGIGDINTNPDRAMQGQSPYVINGTIGYDNPETNVFATALYNVYGPRITEAGALGIPDTYQQPVHVVDVVGGVQFDNGVKAGIKVSNLLNWPQTFLLGDTIENERYLNGWDLGLKIGWGI